MKNIQEKEEKLKSEEKTQKSPITKRKTSKEQINDALYGDNPFNSKKIDKSSKKPEISMKSGDMMKMAVHKEQKGAKRGRSSSFYFSASDIPECNTSEFEGFEYEAEQTLSSPVILKDTEKQEFSFLFPSNSKTEE